MPRAAIRLAVTWFVAAARCSRSARSCPASTSTASRGARGRRGCSASSTRCVWPLLIAPRAAVHRPDARARRARAQRRGRAARRGRSTPGVDVRRPRRGRRRRARAHGRDDLRRRRCSRIDDDDLWYRHVVAPAAQRRGEAAIETDVPGLLFLEIDGLAHDVLRARDARRQRARRSRAGCATARTGSRAGRPTGPRRPAPARPGLLHGDNDDMPAFRWWEKDRGARDRHQPPARRGRARAPPLQRPRAAATPTAPAARTSSPATRRTRC